MKTLKLKIASIVTCLLGANAGISLYLFFALNSEGNPTGSNTAFVIGFLSICLSIILLPTKPFAFANPKGFRTKYWQFLNK